MKSPIAVPFKVIQVKLEVKFTFVFSAIYHIGQMSHVVIEFAHSACRVSRFIVRLERIDMEHPSNSASQIAHARR